MSAEERDHPGGQWHLIQFSTGAASAEVAFMVAEQYGTDRLVLITADTRVEDEDNWRFAIDVVRALPGATWTMLCDGRTPMQAGRDARCVPNNRMAVCSKVLKRELIRAHLDDTYDPAEAIVYLGYDWFEADRIDSAAAHWLPWRVENPLFGRKPAMDKVQLLDHMRDVRGIEPPRLYKTGAPHANCGGCCVRGGQDEWRRVLFHNRPRYLEWEDEEETTRRMLGKDVSILRDRRSKRDKEGVALSLRDFRERLEVDATLFDADDKGACGCDPWAAA